MREILKKREFTLILIIAVMLLVIITQAPSFVSPTNILRIVNDTSILIMVSIGQFMVILTGGIDLSVGSIIAFSGMAASMMNQYFPEMPVILILFAGIGIGTILGLINGVLIAFGKVPPIITTLGTMSIFRGFTFVMSKGQWVTAHEMTESYMNIPHGAFLGISNLIWAGLIVSLVMYYFMKYVRTGREIYAIGGNKVAALFVGVKEKKINIIVYTLVDETRLVNEEGWKDRVTGLVTKWEFILFILLLLEIIIFSNLTPYFLNTFNLLNTTFTFSEKAILALPMIFIILSGDIDISVAGIMALSSFAMGLLNISAKVMIITTGALLIIAVLIPGLMDSIKVRNKLKRQQNLEISEKIS